MHALAACELWIALEFLAAGLCLHCKAEGLECCEFLVQTELEGEDSCSMLLIIDPTVIYILYILNCSDISDTACLKLGQIATAGLWRMMMTKSWTCRRRTGHLLLWYCITVLCDAWSRCVTLPVLTGLQAQTAAVWVQVVSVIYCYLFRPTVNTDYRPQHLSIARSSWRPGRAFKHAWLHRGGGLRNHFGTLVLVTTVRIVYCLFRFFMFLLHALMHVAASSCSYVPAFMMPGTQSWRLDRVHEFTHWLTLTVSFARRVKTHDLV